MHIVWSFLVFVFVVVFASNGFTAEQVLRVSSGAAPAEKILQPIADAFYKDTGIKLQIKVANSKIAMEDLLAGRADVAGAGASFEGIMNLLKKENIPVQDPSQLKHVVVGKDLVRVITNKANPVQSLSLAQLKDIYTGKVTNWKEITGKDAPIKIIYRSLKGCITNEIFSQQVLKGEKFTTDVVAGTTFEDIIAKLVAEPNGITIIPDSFVDDTFHVVKTPEVSRPLILVTLGEPKGPAKTLIDYVTKKK